MKKCTYCNKQYVKLTKEHVVNKEFIKKFYNEGKGFSKKHNALTIEYLTAKDVCAKCNNGVLSELDSSFLRFYEENLPTQLIEPKTEIFITYNFEKISKWLLKTIYNSERINHYPNLPMKMHRYANYIIGKDNRIKLFRIYLELLSDVPKDKTQKLSDLPEGFNGKFDFLKMSTSVSSEELYKEDKEITKNLTSSNFHFHIFLLDPGRHTESVFKARLINYKKELGTESLYYISPNDSKLKLIASNRTIIDILKNTIEGNRPFSDRE